MEQVSLDAGVESTAWTRAVEESCSIAVTASAAAKIVVLMLEVLGRGCVLSKPSLSEKCDRKSAKKKWRERVCATSEGVRM